MEIKINADIMHYIKQKYQSDSVDNQLDQIITRVEKDVYQISDENAENIREWALDRMQFLGFDLNYQPTKEGVLLEKIIDVLTT